MCKGFWRSLSLEWNDDRIAHVKEHSSFSNQSGKHKVGIGWHANKMTLFLSNYICDFSFNRHLLMTSREIIQYQSSTGDAHCQQNVLLRCLKGNIASKSRITLWIFIQISCEIFKNLEGISNPFQETNILLGICILVFWMTFPTKMAQMLSVQNVVFKFIKEGINRIGAGDPWKCVQIPIALFYLLLINVHLVYYKEEIPPVLFRTNYYSIEILHGVTAIILTYHPHHAKLQVLPKEEIQQ